MKTMQYLKNQWKIVESNDWKRAFRFDAKRDKPIVANITDSICCNYNLDYCSYIYTVDVNKTLLYANCFLLCRWGAVGGGEGGDDGSERVDENFAPEHMRLNRGGQLVKGVGYIAVIV